MDPGLILGIVLLVLTFVAAGVALLVAYLRSRPKWQVTTRLRVEYMAPQGFDSLRLDAALHNAAEALAGVPGWSAVELIRVMKTVGFIVNPVPVWTDIWGRRVAGLYSGGVIFVGSDLASLAHELAHAYESIVLGKTDDNHSNWGTNGVFKAIDQYAAP